MKLNKTTKTNKTLLHKQFALQTPGRVFRFAWLAVGLILGYIISLFDLRGAALLSLLAILTGVSANWSS